MSTHVNPLAVLVVEDDADTRALFRSTLRAEGFLVIAAEDGADALRVIDSQSPAAVVLDLGLPRVSGRDVYHEMTALGLPDRIPVIVVTGDVNVNEAEFACLLRKPVDPHELVHALRRCLRDHERKGPEVS